MYMKSKNLKIKKEKKKKKKTVCQQQGETESEGERLNIYGKHKAPMTVWGENRIKKEK